MPKKTINIVKGPEPKFLFVNKDREYAVVTTMSSTVDGGTPIVPDGYDDEGDDMTYVGRVADDTPEGEVDQENLALPEEE